MRADWLPAEPFAIRATEINSPKVPIFHYAGHWRQRIDLIAVKTTPCILLTEFTTFVFCVCGRRPHERIWPFLTVYSKSIIKLNRKSNGFLLALP